MTSWTRSLRVFGAAALAASLVLAGGSGRVALANGIGDLYVADPKGVLEIYLKASIIENQIPNLPATPSMLAFSANGTTLYASDKSTDLYQIKISDLSHSGPTRTAAPIAAMAYPFGSSLFVAVQGSKTLSVLTDGAASFADGPTLPSAPDLLAADSRETRFAAAAKDGSWVAIVEPASSKVIAVGGSAGIGGKVVDMAVARAEGYVWVATTGPNRVALVSLSTGQVASSAPLDAAPTSVTALGKYAVASAGSDLFRVQGTKASAWATAPAKVVGLASDLSAQFVYVATTDKVIALSVTDPKASPAASVALKNGAPAALAPVPNRGSSLAAATGANGSPTPSGHNGSAIATGKPHKTHPPSTDALDTLVPSGSANVDLGMLILGLGGVVVGVLFGSRYMIKRLVGES
jgi:hypothetical protein